MKTCLILATFIFATTSFACVNYSGKYLTGDYNEELLIKQIGCNSVSFETPESSYTVIANGTYQQTRKDDIFVGGVKYGSMTLFQKAEFSESELLLNTTVHLESNEGDIEEQKIKLVATLNKDLDLVTVQTNDDGETETIINKRVK